jgi:hypothetical protein
MASNEIWKNIEEYPKYQVSNHGRIKSLDFNGTKKKKILTPVVTRKGYLNINLYLNGKIKNIPIHRLVAKAFIENPENKPQVNHIDGNKKNNNVSNLEWCTNQENMLHAFKTGLNKHMRAVIQYDKEGNLLRSWRSMSDASKHYGISRAHIQHCCKGKRPSAGGFKWKYKEEIA